MTFVFVDEPTFPSPVTALIHGAGGKTRKAEFSVIFKALPKTEVDALLKRIRDSAKAVAEDPNATPLTDREVLDEILVDFGPDLLDADRKPMVFSKANVDRVCEKWGFEPAIVKSFFANYVNASAKN